MLHIYTVMHHGVGNLHDIYTVMHLRVGNLHGIYTVIIIIIIKKGQQCKAGRE